MCCMLAMCVFDARIVFSVSVVGVRLFIAAPKASAFDVIFYHRVQSVSKRFGQLSGSTVCPVCDASNWTSPMIYVANLEKNPNCLIASWAYSVWCRCCWSTIRILRIDRVRLNKGTAWTQNPTNKIALVGSVFVLWDSRNTTISNHTRARNRALVPADDIKIKFFFSNRSNNTEH